MVEVHRSSADPGLSWKWLTVTIELAVGPFRGSFQATGWRSETLSAFRSDLQRLYDTLEGEASSHPDCEGSLAVKMRGDGLGHIEISGEACADAACGPWLRFQLPDIDQTYLPGIISAVEEIESEFGSGQEGERLP
jgi:hypothetical protein